MSEEYKKLIKNMLSEIETLKAEQTALREERQQASVVVERVPIDAHHQGFGGVIAQYRVSHHCRQIGRIQKSSFDNNYNILRDDGSIETACYYDLKEAAEAIAERKGFFNINIKVKKGGE